MNLANLSDEGCRAYNDAVRYAAKLAYDHRESLKNCFSVYRVGEAFYVRGQDEPRPENSKKVCIAQFWSSNDHYHTVQIRFDGARSEWVYF